MKKTFKFLSLVLTVIMCFSLIGCLPSDESVTAPLTKELLMGKVQNAFEASATVKILEENELLLVGSSNKTTADAQLKYDGDNYSLVLDSKAQVSEEIIFAGGKYYVSFMDGTTKKYIEAPFTEYLPDYSKQSIFAEFYSVANDKNATVQARKNGNFYELTAVQNFDQQVKTVMDTLKKYLVPVNGNYMTLEDFFNDILNSDTEAGSVRAIFTALKLLVNTDTTFDGFIQSYNELTGGDFAAENPDIYAMMLPYKDISVKQALSKLDAATVAAIEQVLGIKWYSGEITEQWLDNVFIEGIYNALATIDLGMVMDIMYAMLISSGGITDFIPSGMSFSTFVSTIIEGVSGGKFSVTAKAKFDIDYKLVSITKDTAINVNLSFNGNLFDKNGLTSKSEFFFSDLNATAVTAPVIS